MSFDRQRFDDDNQARLRTIPGVTVGPVDSVEEALVRQGPVPFLGTLYDGAKGGERLVAAAKGQRLRVRLSVVIVTESWRSRAGGRDGALDLLQDVSDTLVTKGSRYGEWQSPQADGPYIFEEESFMQRGGKRVAYQADFYTHAYNDFN